MKLPPNQVQEIDRPELTETFVDSLGNGSFDGQTARLTLSVTRLDPISPSKPPTAKRYPACRLVLPPDAVIALFNQLQQLIGVMEQHGLVKRENGQPRTIN